MKARCMGTLNFTLAKKMLETQKQTRWKLIFQRVLLIYESLSLK